MDLPPTNDNETSSPAPDSEGAGAKKTTRRKTTRTPRGPKKTKAAAPAAEPELAFSAPEPAPEPASRAERKTERAAEPKREPESKRESEPKREPAPVRAPEPERAPAPTAASASEPTASESRESSVPVESSAPAAESDGGAPAAAAENAGGGQPSQHGQGHGQKHGGDWQQDRGGGGGEGGRDFWKRNKRKRGRHGGGGGGGHWQPGGGGGGNRPQHPPQPPPPSNAPVIGELPNPSRFADLAALATLAGEVSSGGGDPIWLHELYALTLAELTAFATRNGIVIEGAPNKKQLLSLVLASAAGKKQPIRDRGYIDLTDRGAFIVHEHVNYRLYPEDPYLPESLIKLYGLKRGHRVEVLVQAPQPGERCPSVVRIDSVMGMAPDDISKIVPFEELVPYYPLKRILLERSEPQKDVSMRAVDILTPIGFGQRALIVAPPRTGKTVLLQNIANSITENSPDAKLILLLIDERPEEVTDFKRHTRGEVVSSTFDETPESHVHCAEMVIENARRRVELGEHVVILLDSITRLARAYNALTSGGKTMSGGLESNALQKPKRFFGSARNIEGGGSLTIIASALIDTGSRMDEIIFEEFKGTGNCELHLDRGLVERRIFPAINIDRSGTRKEELIYHPEELQRIYGLRRAMQGLGPIESMEMLITRLKKTGSNAEFLLALGKQ